MSKPLVSIVMGSANDWEVMQQSARALQDFGVEFDARVISAHRSPDLLFDYIKDMTGQGVQCFIAGAGGAAHLAGVVASFFPLPVIGVPIKSSALNGLDALFSIVQMPPGVPVACVGINNAKNAALLAIQILAASDKGLQKKVGEYKKKLAKIITEKNIKLNKIGIKKYLKGGKK